jgi:hypothetical protein
MHKGAVNSQPTLSAVYAVKRTTGLIFQKCNMDGWSEISCRILRDFGKEKKRFIKTCLLKICFKNIFTANSLNLTINFVGIIKNTMRTGITHVII